MLLFVIPAEDLEEKSKVLIQIFILYTGTCNWNNDTIVLFHNYFFP